MDLVLKLVGIFLIMLARHMLTQCYMMLSMVGARLTRFEAPQTLLWSGPYAIMRHPVYFFSFVLWLGISLILWPPMFIAFLLFVPFQIWRAIREERVLALKLGAEWSEYKARIWWF